MVFCDRGSSFSTPSVMPVFSAWIPGQLKIGDRILVAGKIKENATKFSLNLCAEEGDEPRDIVLHFEVRFHRDNIISLSRSNGTWVGSGSYDTNCNLFVRAWIPGQLKIGDRILVAGKIKENATKFSLNLCAEEGDEPRDIVLHFEVRFHRDNIISLSRSNGTWVGSGSYDTNCNLFVRGTTFRIVFELSDSGVITIYCQSKFHSNFLPKIPVAAARYVVVWEDVERVTQLDIYMGQHGSTREDSPVPRGMPPPPPMMDRARSMPRNRHGVCANEYSRQRQRLRASSSSGSGDEELRRRDSEVTLTDHTETHTETYDTCQTSREYEMQHGGDIDDEEYIDDVESDRHQEGGELTTASSVGSTIRVKKRGSFYSKARVPFQQVCDFVSKTRKARRHQ